MIISQLSMRQESSTGPRGSLRSGSGNEESQGGGQGRHGRHGRHGEHEKGHVGHGGGGASRRVRARGNRNGHGNGNGNGRDLFRTFALASVVATASFLLVAHRLDSSHRNSPLSTIAATNKKATTALALEASGGGTNVDATSSQGVSSAGSSSFVGTSSLRAYGAIESRLALFTGGEKGGGSGSGSGSGSVNGRESQAGDKVENVGGDERSSVSMISKVVAAAAESPGPGPFDHLPPYEVSGVCPGCRHAIYFKGQGLTCGQRAEQILEVSSSSKPKTKNSASGGKRGEVVGGPNATFLSSAMFENAHRLVAKEQLKRQSEGQRREHEKEGFKQKKVTSCARCQAGACQDGMKQDVDSNVSKNDGGNVGRYWRYDRTAPSILSGTTHYLPSIPNEWRAPPPPHGNVTQYLRDAWAANKTAPMMFEYNPTLLRLTDRSLKSLEAERFPSDFAPVYLASYRISSEVACFERSFYDTIEKEQTKLMKKRQNYLGLALLDNKLRIVPGSDVVIDIESALLLREPPPSRIGKHLVDFRIYVFDDVMYLNINGPPVFVAPFDLVRPSDPYKPAVITDETIKKADKGGGGIRLPNMFGDGMEMVLGHDLNAIWTEHPWGKNYAFFRGDDRDNYGAGEVYAEVQVHSPRIVHRVHLDSPPYLRRYRDVPLSRRHHVSQGKINRVELREASTDNATVTYDDPEPTHATVDELWFPKPIITTQPRGGACCVRLDARHTDKIPVSVSNPGGVVLLGIGHAKIPFKPWMKTASEEQLADIRHHQYFSFLYAFESHPPFRMVAKSGLFCFGFASDGEGDGRAVDAVVNPYTPLTWNRKLSVKRKAFDCPEIQFVSGVTEMVGDDGDDNSRAIVSYGINDCTPRMVVVDKSELARVLFGEDMPSRRGSAARR